jgi:putative ABC transport system permease protein
MNLRDWQLRARALFVPRRVERELDDELSFHLERETQKLIAEGMTGAEARAKALARFGPVPLAADECRDARGTAFVEDTGRDILYALRTFKRCGLPGGRVSSGHPRRSPRPDAGASPGIGRPRRNRARHSE